MRRTGAKSQSPKSSHENTGGRRVRKSQLPSGASLGCPFPSYWNLETPFQEGFLLLVIEKELDCAAKKPKQESKTLHNNELNGSQQDLPAIGHHKQNPNSKHFCRAQGCQRVFTPFPTRISLDFLYTPLKHLVCRPLGRCAACLQGSRRQRRDSGQVFTLNSQAPS